MYNYIKGKYICSGDGFIVIEAGGIGYTIYTSLNTVGKLSGRELVTVYTYLYLREGIMDLYGFATEEERKMFTHLISISGIGPKAAVSILSIAPPEAIAMAIINGDSALIQKAQGVGAKGAQRVVLELKDKLKGIDINLDGISDIAVGADNRSEALSALLVLGYSEVAAKAALKNVSGELTTEEIIKSALKNML